MGERLDAIPMANPPKIRQGTKAANEAANKRATHCPPLLRRASQMKEFFVERLGATDYDPVVSEEQATKRSNRRNGANVRNIKILCASCNRHLLFRSTKHRNCRWFKPFITAVLLPRHE